METKDLLARELGPFIRRMRIAKKMSQLKLCKLSKVSHPTLVKIEKGDLTVGLRSVYKLCNSLGLNLKINVIINPNTDESENTEVK